MSDGRPHTDEVAADTVNHEIVDHVAIITLNRPMSLNAFTMDMEERLVELLWESQRDRRVRCVVITGAAFKPVKRGGRTAQTKARSGLGSLIAVGKIGGRRRNGGNS